MASPIENLYGALLLGTFFSLILYGLMLHQTYRYFRVYPNDEVNIRVLVWCALVCETLHTIFSMHGIYRSLVTNYNDTAASSMTIWSFDALPITAELSIILSLVFFVQRVWMMGLSNKWIIVLACAGILGRFGFCVVMTVYLVTSGVMDFPGRIQRQHGLVVSGKYGCSTVAHIILTSSLLYVIYLGQRHRKGSNTISRSLMENFMLYVLNTGLLVSICDIVSWILAYAVARTAWWIAFDTATTKLYLITFLSVLNSRDMAITRGIEIFGSDATYGLNAIERAARQARAERYNAPQIPDIGPTKIDIKVATEIEGENQTTRDMMADDSDAHKPGQVFRL
ncbi:hypothetical protein BD309DRAFT_972428 [Dichomitus squalens]|nr:hypothetical protein BD309DRAFT_972428 [Dichomitus squalens]